MDVEIFRSAYDVMGRPIDLIVPITSGGAVSDPEEARAAPLELEAGDGHPHSGTVNFGDEVFLNPSGLVERFYGRMRSLSILPEFEIFDSGMLAGAERVGGEKFHHHRGLPLRAGSAWRHVLPYRQRRVPRVPSCRMAPHGVPRGSEGSIFQ